MKNNSPALEESGRPQKAPFRFGLFVAALVLAEITSAFEVSMIFAAMPRFIRVFGDPVSAGWILTSCLLVSAVAAALCARFGDMYGRRTVLLMVLAACAVGSFISATSESLGGIIIGTAIQGLSGAILPLCIGLASERLPPRKVPLVVGIVVGAALTGGGGGLLLGGWLVDRFDWHAIFYCSALFAVAGAASIAVWVPRRKHKVVRGDVKLLQGAAFAPGIVLLMYGIGQIQVRGLGDLRTAGFLVAGLVILAIWFVNQWRQPNPLINVRLFRVPAIAASYVCMACAGLGAFQFGYVLSLYLQQPKPFGGLGLTATATGALLGPVLWAGLVGGPVSGGISARFGPRVAAILGMAMLTFGWAVLAIERESTESIVFSAILLGLGLPIVYAALPTLIVSHAPPDRVSEATGMNSVVRAIFQAMGAAVVALLLSLDMRAVHATLEQFPTSWSYGLVFSYISVISGVGMLVILLSVRSEPAPAEWAESKR